MTLVATRLQNMREMSNIDVYENRPSRWGAYELYKLQSESPTGILTENLKRAAQSSIGRTLQIPVINYDSSVSIGNVRTVTVADSENTSALVDVTFATLAWGFTQTPTMFLNNEIDAQKDFNVKMQKYINKVGATLDGLALANLVASKTQIITDALGYTVSGNSVQVPLAQRENFLGDIDSIMMSNDFYNSLHLVGGAGLTATINRLKQHGANNDQNKVLQYMDKTIHYTNGIANGVGEFANIYAVAADSVGLLTRFDRESLAETKTNIGYEWSKELLPMLNLEVGVMYYEGVGDYSAIAGAASADMTASFKQHFGFSIDVAFISAYNSNRAAIASPILKATMLTA